ncbi:MAG TPA: methyltransferase domain-containing protein [Candidatus Glassbacteria bacterium]|nr:methyltransferase domain-containing protein [Candidatus Glassbacteria bacterium]
METTTKFRKNEVLEYQINLNDNHVRRNSTHQRYLRRVEDIIHIRHYCPAAMSVLCVGARDDSEVQTFIDHGFNAKGIDICKESKLITKMDMAELSPKFGTFDIAYCSHVLEHVIDPMVVFKAIRSVTDQAMFVTLPIVDRSPDIEHPTVYEIMKQNPVTNFKNHPDAWRDFIPLEPFQIVYNCYRNGATEEYEIAFIMRLVK